MGRTLLDSNTSFDPETLQLLCRAFDDAWQDIAGNYGHIAAEDTGALRWPRASLCFPSRLATDVISGCLENSCGNFDSCSVGNRRGGAKCCGSHCAAARALIFLGWYVASNCVAGRVETTGVFFMSGAASDGWAGFARGVEGSSSKGVSATASSTAAPLMLASDGTGDRLVSIQGVLTLAIGIAVGAQYSKVRRGRDLRSIG